jgi:GNAT superfamily N-acetyltransferase
VSAVKLIQASEADASAIEALVRQAYTVHAAQIGRKPLPMTVDYAEAVKVHRFDLAYVEGRLAGLVETVPQGDTLLIVNLAVLPDLRGRGLGSRLLAFAEDLAAASSLRGARLYTNRHFTDNLRFYAARGYRVEREEAMNGGVAVHMIKLAD